MTAAMSLVCEVSMSVVCWIIDIPLLRCNLVSSPSCVFQCFMWKKKIGKAPGLSGDVIGCDLRHGCVSPLTHPCSSPGGQRLLCNNHTHCMAEWMEIRNCVQLHHLIDQAFPVLHVKHAGYKANLGDCMFHDLIQLDYTNKVSAIQWHTSMGGGEEL